MLILSRGLNEAVVLADRVLVTLVGLRSGEVDLAIADAGGEPTVVVTLALGGESIDLGQGARVRLIEVREAAAGYSGSGCQGPKARLTFEAPPGVGVMRKELCPEGGGYGPGWYYPRERKPPSPN